MESGTQLESEYLHVPLGKETAVGRKFIGFRQFHYPLFQGSDLGIHSIDHLKGRTIRPETQLAYTLRGIDLTTPAMALIHFINGGCTSPQIGRAHV